MYIVPDLSGFFFFFKLLCLFVLLPLKVLVLVGDHSPL